MNVVALSGALCIEACSQNMTPTSFISCASMHGDLRATINQKARRKKYEYHSHVLKSQSFQQIVSPEKSTVAPDAYIS
eukprot:scaffold349362_cov34-Prasinocladus_malaysianus.AAC.1